MDTWIKHNHTGNRDTLLREAEGLALLADGLAGAGVTAVRVPRVLAVSEQALEMTAITAAPPSSGHMAALGRGLARLHRQRHDRYGLDRDNYIGLSPQPNRWSDDWGSFFADHRLGYQIGRIRDARVRDEFATALQRHRFALVAFLNDHCQHPSLLHGDLWSGNVLFDREGPWLIDPAVYYGDREADLAMTEMFGGFGSGFYRAYDQVYPRTVAYPRKRALYNFYHYLNHYNLFGASYLGGCREGLRALTDLPRRRRHVNSGH